MPVGGISSWTFRRFRSTLLPLLNPPALVQVAKPTSSIVLIHMILRSLVLVLLTTITPVLSRLVNVSIDDTKGDFWHPGQIPQYANSHEGYSWIPRGSALPCPGCGVQPDPAQAFENSWHEVTTNLGQEAPNVTFSFTGIALFVYCILANRVNDVTTETHLAFNLDDLPAGEFNRLSQDPSEVPYLYNQLVYSITNLPNVPHKFIMSNVAAPRFGPAGSLAMFDYAIYTNDNDPNDTPTTTTIPSTTSTPSTTPTTPSTSNTSTQTSSPPETAGRLPTAMHRPPIALILGLVGAVVAVVVAVTVYLWRRRYWQRRQVQTRDPVPDPHRLSWIRQEKLFILSKYRAGPSSNGSSTQQTFTSRNTAQDDTNDRLREEVEYLREEVYRLREQNDGASIAPPPTYVSDVRAQ